MHEIKQKKRENTSSLCVVSGDDLCGQVGGSRWQGRGWVGVAGVVHVHWYPSYVSATPAGAGSFWKASLFSMQESLFVVGPFSLFNFYLMTYKTFLTRSYICVVCF